ncbi:MAG: 6-hydroxymethylpterin diphosphokinase MptE-like protein [Thermoplasmatota archaeon]
MNREPRIEVYDAIRQAFGWARQDDEAAAALLQSLLQRDAWPGFEAANRHAEATVVGAADIRGRPPLHGLVVAADGAVGHLRRWGRMPDVVVTDLDGPPEELAWAADAGAWFVVHAHGHNQEALRDWLPRLPAERTVGTCQVDPLRTPRLSVPGGFTDGDRAVHLLESLGVADVHLVGFDLAGPVGTASYQWDPATKRRKLAWAGQLLGDVAARGRTRLHWVTDAAQSA